MFSILLCLAGMTSPASAAASKSEVVWSLQAALRELNLYNGLVNGAESPELTGAIVALERELQAPQTGALSLQTLGLVERLRVQRQRRSEFQRLFDPSLIESLTAEEFRFFLGGLSADQALRVFEQYPERLADLPGTTYLRTERPPAPEQLARFIDAALLRLDYDGGSLDLDEFRRAQGLALGGAPTVEISPPSSRPFGWTRASRLNPRAASSFGKPPRRCRFEGVGSGWSGRENPGP